MRVLRTPARLMLGAVALICLLIVTGLAQDSYVDSILYRSVGGPDAVARLSEFTSSRLYGTMELNGMSGTYELTWQAPDRVHMVTRFPGFSLVQAWDGHMAWQTDMNGQTSPMHGFERRSYLESVYAQSYAFLFPERMPGRIEYGGVVVKDGRQYYEFLLMPLLEDTLWWYLDPHDGRLTSSLSTMDNIEIVSEYDDYRFLHGVQIAMYTHSEAPALGVVTDSWIDSIVFDPPVSADLFDPPVRIERDFVFPENSDSVTIPIRYKRGLVYVTATINGRLKARFLVDSGASKSILNRTVVSGLNLPERGEIPARGVAGNETVMLVSVDSIQIGSLQLVGQLAGMLDLEGLVRPGKDLPFGGILGYDLLSRFPVLIDYKGRTLTVYNPDLAVEPSGGEEIEFKLTSQVPTVHALIDSVAGDFLVDLGNAFGLILHPDFVERNGLRSGFSSLSEQHATMGGIGGDVKGQSAVATDFVLGTLCLQSPRVYLPAKAGGLMESEEIAGNIGNRVLDRYKVLLDYKKSRLILFLGEPGD